MKAKKVVFILLTGLVISIIDSCCGGCDIMDNFYYSISDFSAIHIDNSGKKPVEITTADKTVLKEAYGIRLTFTSKQTDASLLPHVSLIPSAYALSCEPCDTWHAKDSVISVHITTMNDFDDRHPAGSDVSEYFRVKENNSYLTLDKYFATNYKFRSSHCVDCLLMTAPAITGEHQFQTEARLSDGRTLTSLTTPIMLN